MSESEFNAIIPEGTHLAHYGIRRRSGRYPWGSGANPNQRARDFQSIVADLKAKGMTDTQIAQGFGMTTTDFRATKSIAKEERKAADTAAVLRLKEHGYSNVMIGDKLGMNESSVRSLIAQSEKKKADTLQTIASMLKNEVDTHGMTDVGRGMENRLGISKDKLNTALSMLKEQGYVVENIQTPQVGTRNLTLVKVLAPPKTTYLDIKLNKENIHLINQKTDDGGQSFFDILPPLAINPNRVAIKYKEDGGDKEDGVIYVRPGAKDLSLGGVNYAQVRIKVGKDRYLKGMAVYKDDLPDGVDLLFNTNKSNTGNKLDALKKVQDDPNDPNPFGSAVDQLWRVDRNGNRKLTSAVNIVNKEGDWEGWKKTLSSQVLSKQSPKVAKKQLDEAFQKREDDLNEILSLTNPAVKRKLLETFADDADSAAVHLKAAALPRQRAQVILPVNSLKPSEVYAPNFNHGERVALIRFPHGGIFEIPELVVNNNSKEAKSLLGRAKDAIGIHSDVAARLSGADFDGDTVLVIPNEGGKYIKSQAPLQKLQGFDPQHDYAGYEGMKKMTSKQKQMEMGKVSNLITDMTIKRASNDELARAVRHSMVVIDAEKHGLDWKRSAKENGIAALAKKYQPESRGGGSATLISRASSPKVVNARKRNPLIDPDTGEKIWVPTGESWVDRNTGKTQMRTQRSTKLAEAKNAYELSSGTRIESVYADYSNSVKGLANKARREMVHTPSAKWNDQAKKTYKPEVQTLESKLNTALQNRPLERQAQLIADAQVRQKMDAKPDMDDAELKKTRATAIKTARVRVGAGKEQIDITDREWEAIQAGAISNHKLKQILDNSDIDRVRQLATPKAQVVMGAANLAKARAMESRGLTQAEIARVLGVGLTTLKKSLSEEG